MEKTKTFEDLLVWQKAHEFVLLVYRMTENFPRREVYGLTSQFRRAAVSIAANIAEGYKKKDYKNKLNFLNIAHSSLEECRYYIILSKDLGYETDARLIELTNEVGRLLNAYSKAIASNHSIS
ncbi:four helix bundle protein [Flavisolibacter ginsenosidimutans]|uniref:Four helix bundle protein n=1 Tax=Flavisolibacter ginsenosidimutans TaxID=661481 RepID=A0A5B8UND3_9BACT|nr:four helix bundle protein [Flavisolibacter ginsenosidimutans]QEC57485.1 four helix bundle protein [Flavisolibacter ginsenosidimutans]